MTLGTFLKDYLYYPLGGSRVSRPRLWLNLFVVFFVSGIWHGVGMSYVVMGIYNGVLAATWRLLRPEPSPRRGVRFFEKLLAFQLTAFSVACLRPIPLSRLGEALRSLFSARPAGGLFEGWAVFLLAVAIGLHLSPQRWKQLLREQGQRAPAFALALWVVLVAGICSLYAENTRDFYYFQF
jgi:D-alanyl-lipoteichoic acid acyltransferase DltB (MBOAT superfamily)